MRATTLLMEEHQIILRALRVLEALAARAADGREVPAPAAESVLAFLTGFADSHHHHKEEDILFPAMEEAGFPRDAGPLAVMLHEHDQGRVLIAGLRRSLPHAGWTAEERAGFAGTARAYRALLEGHIGKENQILFPMAERALPRPDQQRVDEAFDAFEAAAAADRARFEREVERLARELL
jgi:hemerythrin-like domain-containing protein